MSRNYAGKLKAIRKAEGLTQKKFAEITGLSLGAVRNYEAGLNEVKALAVEKVLDVKKFQKYTMWLMLDTTNPEYGQVAPDLTTNYYDNAEMTSSRFKTEKKLSDFKEEDTNTHIIKIMVMSMAPDDRARLAEKLYKEGFNFLLECLAPENQLLINLTRNKKRAVLQLVSLSRENFETTVSKMEELIESSSEETNTSKENSAD